LPAAFIYTSGNFFPLDTSFVCVNASKKSYIPLRLKHGSKSALSDDVAETILRPLLCICSIKVFAYGFNTTLSVYALHAASYHSFMISSVDSGRLYFSLVYTEPDSNVCVLISCIYSLDTGIPLLPRKSMSTVAHTCVESSIVPSRSNMIHRQLLRSNMDNSPPDLCTTYMKISSLH
jgi:hypothetical protein